MKIMSQSEFDKLCFCANSKDCNHPDVVRLVDAYTGAHMDYGCMVCGLQHSNRDVFNKFGLEGYK